MDIIVYGHNFFKSLIYIKVINMDNNYGIGKKVKEYRLARGFTQEELAFRAHISSVYLRQIEKDDKSPTLSTILKLCDGLAIHPSALFENFPSPASISTTERQILAFLADKSELEKKIVLELIKTSFKLKH